MDCYINRKYLKILTLSNNVLSRSKPIYRVVYKFPIYSNRNYRKLFQIKHKPVRIYPLYFRDNAQLKELSRKSVKCLEGISESSTLTRSSCSCLINYDNGKSKVSLVGNIGSHEKHLSSYEAPLVHYASRGVVVELQKSFISSRFTTGEKPSSGSIATILSELDVLKEIRNIFLHLYRGKEQNTESTQKENSSVNIEKAAIVHIKELAANKSFYKCLPGYYAGLAKSRLTGLVVLTSMAGYIIAPAPFDFAVFLACALGTALTSSSANTFNQYFEVPYDSQMMRTKNRVLVRGLLSPIHAITFGAVCGGSGLALLYFGVNELTAVLGALNLIIYTSVYTPLKQMSIVNTWVGSIVGAIPPMMGWAGCTASLGPGAFIVGGMLYAWQFPHFNALSWNIRHDYARAGYKMMAISHPDICRRTTLKYSASLILLSTLAPIYDVTTWTFALDSLPLNLYFTYLAWNFYKESDSKSSRKLFRFSLFHLPALLILMLISKKETTKEELRHERTEADVLMPHVLTEPS